MTCSPHIKGKVEGENQIRTLVAKPFPLTLFQTSQPRLGTFFFIYLNKGPRTSSTKYYYHYNTPSTCASSSPSLCLLPSSQLCRRLRPLLQQVVSLITLWLGSMLAMFSSWSVMLLRSLLITTPSPRPGSIRGNEAQYLLLYLIQNYQPNCLAGGKENVVEKSRLTV